MQRLGVFGGCFDPPHTAHLIHARLILERFELEKIIFIPAANPPHKKVHAPFSERFQMIKLAVKGEGAFDVSDIEWKEGLSYTVDTLSRLKDFFPESGLFLIMGRDEYESLTTWHDPGRIRELVEIIVIPRVMKWDGKSEPGAHFPDLPLIEISSSAVRERIAEGKPITNWVPFGVETYLKKTKLYKEI